MGQASQRGTFEERRFQALRKQANERALQATHESSGRQLIGKLQKRRASPKHIMLMAALAATIAGSQNVKHVTQENFNDDD